LFIARLAADTKHIRLGSGGVLLAHYSPLKVAENFRLLEAFAPNRVDLGLGRGTGSNEDAEAALGGNAARVSPYEQQVEDLLRFLGEGFPAGHAFAGVTATPAISRAPEPWLLGSTGRSARLAAELGIPFAFAHFIKGDNEASTRVYREAYRPSARFPHPRVLVAVAAYGSDDAAERDDFLACLCLRRARARLEHDPEPPERESARIHVPTPDERPIVEETTRNAIVDTPAAVGSRLDDIVARHAADELMIVSVTPDYESRRRSYEAIAAHW